MAVLQVEIGKLMARVDGLAAQIEDLKKGMDSTNRQLVRLTTQLAAFSADMMTEMEKKFITRAEIAPIKAVLSVVAATTFSAFCMAAAELFFHKWI